MSKLFFDKAFLQDGWADNVCISVDESGTISRIEIGMTRSNEMQVINGYAVPGMSNLHSHAFQRAMAGMTEIAGNTEDSFWTWRTKMYQFAGSIRPDQLSAIAAQLYMENLKAGFTAVGEFHYLHHDVGGVPFSDPAEMSWSIFEASDQTSIRLTHLPVFYTSSGFGKSATTPEQSRFANSLDQYLALYESLDFKSQNNPRINVGIAPHSLRAVPIDQLAKLTAGISDECPIHIHIAEQIAEVNDCLSYSGARPVEYLLDNLPVNENWCLVHATHLNESETVLLAKSGAVAGLCPITEANLGDGIFPARDFLAQGGRIGIGSDSNILVSLAEELRWLEYGQRLLHKQRNVLAKPNGSAGEQLFRSALSGGAQALGHKAKTGLNTGSPADIVVLDSDDATMIGKSDDNLMDSWIFAGDNSLVKDVFVGGQICVSDGVHIHQEHIAKKFRATMLSLADM